MNSNIVILNHISVFRQLYKHFVIIKQSFFSSISFQIKVFSEKSGSGSLTRHSYPPCRFI